MGRMVHGKIGYTVTENDSLGGSTGAKCDVYTIALFTSAIKVKFSSLFVCLSVSNFAQKLPNAFA